MMINQLPLLKLLQRKHKRKQLRQNLRVKPREMQKRRLNQLLLSMLLLINLLKPHLQQNMKLSMILLQAEAAPLILNLVMLIKQAIRLPKLSRLQRKLELQETDISSQSLLSSITTIITLQLRKYSRHKVCTPVEPPLKSLELGLMRNWSTE